MVHEFFTFYNHKNTNNGNNERTSIYHLNLYLQNDCKSHLFTYTSTGYDIFLIDNDRILVEFPCLTHLITSESVTKIITLHTSSSNE